MDIDSTKLTLWNDIHITSGIPFWIASMDGTVNYAFPKNILNAVQPYFFEFCGMEIRRHELENNVMIAFITDYYYCMLASLDASTFIVSIPLATQKPAPVPFNFVRHFVPKGEVTQIINLITYTEIQSIEQAARCANLIKMIYNGEPVGKILLNQHEPYRESDLHTEPEIVHNGTESIQNTALLRNASLFYEQEIRKAISSGDAEAFLQHISRRVEPGPGLGQISNNPVQQQKYRAVISFFVYVQSAVAGGMDMEFALALSDQYCLKMDALTTVSDVRSLIKTAGVDYCQRIRELQGKQKYSREIALCCKYVSIHLYEPIHIKDLEQVANMNRRSLSIKFKKETGQSIPEYVLKRKLNEAGYLLRTTDMTISEISYLLSFSSQSYFTQLFQKEYQVTPKEYRKNVESENV